MKQETPPPPSQGEPQEEPQRKSGWLATLGRILRDNAALLAALLALAGVIYTQVVTTNNTQAGLAAQRELEEERAREAELQAYFDDMATMLLDEDKPLPEVEPGSPKSVLARAKTLTILERLDGERAGVVLQFLYESRLILKGEPIVNLTGASLRYVQLANPEMKEADLRGANLNKAELAEANLSESNLRDALLAGATLSLADLSGADLRDSDLTDANLTVANLNGADLSDGDNTGGRHARWLGFPPTGADLRRAHLSGADLSEANLSGADLSGAILYDVDLSEADLSGADLSGADLSDAKGVTNEQLEEQTKSLEGATMPDRSKHD